MKAVFADAFYFVACLNRADQHHKKSGFLRVTEPAADCHDNLGSDGSRRRIYRFDRPG